MTAHLKVDPQGLRANAAKLDAIGGDIHTAAAAGTQTALNVKAFGLLCSFMVPTAMTLQQTSADGIQGVAEAVKAVASTLRQSAQGYDDVEDELVKQFEKIAEQV